MNRLVLIGNGFDIAHKIKTSYNDFILKYLQISFSEARIKREFSDRLIHIKAQAYFAPTPFNNYNINDWKLENFYHFINDDNDSLQITVSGDFTDRHFNNEREFSVTIKSKLASILLSNCKEYNWVNIENEYYNVLCKLSSENKKKEIVSLNEDFYFLQILLHNYLTEIEEEYCKLKLNISESKLVEKLTEYIKHNATPKHRKHLDKNGIKPQSILFLNFNYTSTVEKYLPNISDKISQTDVIYIHGKLNDHTNPIIFGYGDEEETNFQLLENYDESLKYVKTYHYLRTNNYENFLNFINSGEFEVYIVEHSCGLSDKTMLSSIFNNSNCKKIKILTYDKSFGEKKLSIDTTNYIEMTYQIGRLFKDKAELRKKLISFNIDDLLCL